MRAAVAFLSCLSASGLAMWKTHVHYGTTETLKSFGVTSLKCSEKKSFKESKYPFLSSEQKLLDDVLLSNSEAHSGLCTKTGAVNFLAFFDQSG